MRGKAFLAQKGIKYMGSYWLNDDDKKELRSMLPNFQLRQFHKWMKFNDDNFSYQNELIFWPYSYHGSLGQIGYPAISFECNSSKIKKYNEWLGTDDRIFMRPYIKKYQSHLNIVKNCLTKMF